MGATDLVGIQPAALDQPRINAFLSFGFDLPPQSFEGTFNISAFLDTGASGVLLSANTAGYLGVQPSVFGPDNQEVIFRDVGVGGSSDFYVSNPVHIGLAPYHPNADVDNPATYQSVYNQQFSNIRAQIGPINLVDPNPLLADLDVFGMPVMQGKVVVMDPRPVDTFADTMRTYVYNPGTPYNEAEQATNPGIPQTSRSIQLSYADVSRFTEVVPNGAPTATLANNPFIGPNPVLKLDTGQSDGTPAVKMGYGDRFTEGSFLLDTGAAASIISEHVAAELNVRYDPTAPADDPRLLGVPAGEQFQLTIGGIGGTKKIAGFYLDSFLMRTEQGDVNNDEDPNHIRFLGAPVLVYDIEVADPTKAPGSPGSTLTLDGIFGMNFLVATAYVTEAEPFPIIDLLTPGFFKWVVFDQVEGKLNLELNPSRGPDGAIQWFGDEEPVVEWAVGKATWINGGFQLVEYQDGDSVRFGDFVYDTTAYRIVLPGDVEPGSVFFGNDVDIDYTMTGPGRIVGLTGLTKAGSRSLRVETSNAYFGQTEVIEGTLTFAAPQDIGPVRVSGGKLVVESGRQRFERLTVQPGAEVKLARRGNVVVNVERLGVREAGKMDIEDNAVVVRPGVFELADALREVNAAAKRGYDDGWAGEGLTSSAAAEGVAKLTSVAVILNDDGTGTPFHTAFFGESVDEESILVAWSWTGDLNLDGRVDARDYSVINANFAALEEDPSLEVIYGDGDLNYDGRIDADDYWMMDRARLRQTGTFPVAPVAASGGVQVPEPGVGMMVLGLAGVWGTRRRRGR